MPISVPCSPGSLRDDVHNRLDTYNQLSIKKPPPWTTSGTGRQQCAKSTEIVLPYTNLSIVKQGHSLFVQGHERAGCVVDSPQRSLARACKALPKRRGHVSSACMRTHTMLCKIWRVAICCHHTAHRPTALRWHGAPHDHHAPVLALPKKRSGQDCLM